MYLENAKSDDRQSWPGQHTWFMERLEEFHGALSQRIKDLNADDWPTDEDGEEDGEEAPD